MPDTLDLTNPAFDPANAAPDLVALNAAIAAEHARRPDPWSVSLPEVRAARDAGLGIFPAVETDPQTREAVVEVPGAPPVGIRVIRPNTGEPRGTFLHFHGGGWVFGRAWENDRRLRRLAEATGLATVSVEYRLAPEDPFPAAPDDCLAVARALVDGRIEGAPAGLLAIGGESAGAHLAVLTLVRLRDECGSTPFRAANLVAGYYDLSLTPSAAASTDRLIINNVDLDRFALCAVGEGGDRRSPLVSPLHADLGGLPPARFSCGTADALLDDSLYMASRWAAAGNTARLALTNGGCHVFEVFGTPSGIAALDDAETFLNAALDRAG